MEGSARRGTQGRRDTVMRSLRSMDILILLSREEAPSIEARGFRVECGTWGDVASARPGLILQGTKVALYLRLLSRPMNRSSL